MAKIGFNGPLASGPIAWIGSALATMLGVILLGLLFSPGKADPPPVAAAPSEPAPAAQPASPGEQLPPAPPAVAPSAPMTPVAPPAPVAVDQSSATVIDLLAMLNLKTDVKLGTARIRNGVLSTSAEDIRTLVSIPYDLPPQYELEMLVTRVTGSDGFILGLNMNSQPCMLTIDGWPTTGGPWATLQQLDGKGPLDADFPGVRYVGELLKQGQPSRVRLKVDGMKYDLRVDDLQVLDGDATGRTLSRARFYNNRDYEHRPFVASYESHFTIESITLRVP